MKVELLEKEITEWVKAIEIKKDGKYYRVDLRWDAHNGYEILAFWHNSRVIDTPEWANVPEFEYELDSATEKVTNA